MPPVQTPEAPAELETSVTPLPENQPPGISPLEAMRAKQKAGGNAPAKIHPKRSQWAKAAMHLMRRGHLYAGLLLLPWVFLYGITGFLFNHPEVWSDNPTTAITKTHTAGTELARLPKAQDIAVQVVAALNVRGTEKYTLVEPEKVVFGRGGMGATLTGADGKSYSVSLLSNGTGTIRSGVVRGGPGGGPGGPAPTAQSGRGEAGGRRSGEGSRGEGNSRGSMGRRGEGAAGAVMASAGPVSAIDDLSTNQPAERSEGRPARGEGSRSSRGGDRRESGMGGGERQGGGEGRGGQERHGERDGSGMEGRGGAGREELDPPAPFAVAEGLKLDPSPVDMIQKGLPTVLERVEMKDATVASVRLTPINFTVEGAGKTWLATYIAETGSVTGREAAAQAAEGPGMSFRRFLLRLHTAHGYPAEDVNMRWLWALLVDATSLVMVFWGISGIVMWWQIKRTRLLGGACLLFSTAAATYIGIGMHELIVAAGR